MTCAADINILLPLLTSAIKLRNDNSVIVKIRRRIRPDDLVPKTMLLGKIMVQNSMTPKVLIS